MSGNERPELRAFQELETLVRNLGEELAAFRRRALVAESQLRESGHQPSGGSAGLGDRLANLESENSALRARMGRSEERVRQMLERVRFLRQQLQTQVTGAGAGAGRA